MKTENKDRLLISFVAALFFIPFLGGVHLFDWDEINFAECAREMLLSGKYLQVQIGFQPFWEKPPFFFWMQVLSMKAFGLNEFAARLPNALIGIANLLLIYQIGLQLKNRLFARLWALAWFGSLLPHLYARSGIIDPWFNFWIFLALWSFFQAQSKSHGGQDKALLGGFLLGLAVLTKGPVAILIALLTLVAYLLYGRDKRQRLSANKLLLFASATLLTSITWFAVDIALNGTWLTTEFIKYQYRLFSTPDAGHAGFPGYHFVVLLVGCFPASVFALSAFAKQKQLEGTDLGDFRRWMLVLFWVVLILFSLVKSKIVHYSSLAYYPLTFLAALSLYNLWEKGLRLAKWQAGILAVLASGISAAALALPWIGQHMSWFLEHFPPADPFALESMQASVSWGVTDYLPGLLLLFCSAASIVLARRAYWKAALPLLFGGTALFVQTTLYLFIGKIETYSQRAAVEFCESKAGEEVYISPLYYKTYVHWFYGHIPKDWPEEAKNTRWLLKGPIDRDAFFLVKANHWHLVQKEHPQLELLYKKNGFAFFKRAAQEQKQPTQ